MAADDDQLGGLGLLEQVMRGPIENNDATHADIGVALLPARQAFGEGFMRPRFGHAPFQRTNTERVAVAGCVQSYHFDTTP